MTAENRDAAIDTQLRALALELADLLKRVAALEDLTRNHKEA